MTNPRRKICNWYYLGPFTIFDVETTGMSQVNDRIVEIAAVRIGLEGNLSRYHALVNPGCRIPASATRVHHITNEMVASADDFSIVGADFLDFIKGSTLIAHNGHFDLRFLQESLHRVGLPVWDGKTMDSIPLIKQAYPDLPSYSLPYLKMRFGLGSGDEKDQAHRAFCDVEWTLEIVEIALTELLKRTGRL